MNILLILSLLLPFVAQLQCKPWTWRYEQQYTTESKQLHKDTLVFTQTSTPAFDQLILSWNALRPALGHFRFEVQIKQGKRWSKWLRYAEWGRGVQRSFFDSDISATNHYVRLEIAKEKATGFKVRVLPIDGADLATMQSLMVTICDKGSFTSEVHASYIQKLPLVQIHNVPPYSQMITPFIDHTKICSPSAVATVISYWTNHHYDPTKFCAECFDYGLNIYGSWPFCVAAAYDATHSAVKCHVTRLQSVQELYDLLKKGMPVCVSITGNALINEQPLYCTRRGHIVVVTGIDPQTGIIYVNDSAFIKRDEVTHAYPLKKFIQAWECSHRLAYVSSLSRGR